MSLDNVGSHSPNGPKRRQPQPEPSVPSHADENASSEDTAVDVTFFFRGSIRPKARSAIERAITGLEERRSRPKEQTTRWLVARVGSEETPAVLATRLTDGRTFRMPTPKQLIAKIQAATAA
jgi:hypothetical protein